VSHAIGTHSRFAQLLKNALGVRQKQLAGCTQSHAAREAFEKFEAQLLLQILNRRESAGCATRNRRAARP